MRETKFHTHTQHPPNMFLPRRERPSFTPIHNTLQTMFFPRCERQSFTPIHNTLQICSSLDARDKVSHPYTTPSKYVPPSMRQTKFHTHTQHPPNNVLPSMRVTKFHTHTQHPPNMFLPRHERPSFTPIHNTFQTNLRKTSSDKNLKPYFTTWY